MRQLKSSAYTPLLINNLLLQKSKITNIILKFHSLYKHYIIICNFDLPFKSYIINLPAGKGRSKNINTHAFTQ
jgi:hypothetical protein